MRYTLICLVILFSSCKEKQAIPVAHSHFSKAEMINLEQLVGYFESKICPSVTDRTQCLKSYYKEISDRPDLGKTNLNAKLNPVELFATIDRPLTNKIWFPYRTQSADGKSKVSRNLSARGAYMNYLHQLAAFNPDLFLNYSNTLHESGNLSVTMAKEVRENIELLDLENFDHRLFLTIHFLTISQK